MLADDFFCKDVTNELNLLNAVDTSPGQRDNALMTRNNNMIQIHGNVKQLSAKIPKFEQQFECDLFSDLF